MEQMTYHVVKELISNEFNEYLYAKYSPLGATSAILYDYNDYFESDSQEYHMYIKSLFLINCTSHTLEWYKEYSPDFLEIRIIPHFMDTIRFETTFSEMQQLIRIVRGYLSNEFNDIDQVNNLISSIEETEAQRDFVDLMFIKSKQLSTEKDEKQNKSNTIKIDSVYKALKIIQEREKNYEGNKNFRKFVDFSLLHSNVFKEVIEEVVKLKNKDNLK